MIARVRERSCKYLTEVKQQEENLLKEIIRTLAVRPNLEVKTNIELEQ